MIEEERLSKLGIVLPEVGEPKAMYISVKRTGNLLFVSGQIPMRNEEVVFTGKVGVERTLEEGQEAAKICIINMLAVIKQHLGDLSCIKEFINIRGFVSSSVGFDQQHIVINAASQLLFDVFGLNGRHTRTAIAVNQLPLDATVEIEAIVEVKS